MVSISIHDDFNFFKVLNCIDIGLYLFVCIRFNDTVAQIPFALNLALMLQWVLQSAIGPVGWPEGLYTNAIILCFFALFFYHITSKLWASVFLVIGMLFINPVWEGVRLELEQAMSSTLDMSVSASTHSYIFFGLLAALVFIGFVTLISKNFYIQLVVIAFTYSTKLMTAIKGLMLSQDTIVCQSDHDSSQCPFWYNTREWVAVGVLSIIRCIMMLMLAKGFCRRSFKSKCYNSTTATDNDSDSSEEEEEELDLIETEPRATRIL